MLTSPKLEWVRQLSQDSNNFVIAVVRNQSKAGLLNPLLGDRVAIVEGDVSDVDSFPVSFKIQNVKSSDD
jgi:hypothetical protein